jgi:hypothetical protein
MAPYPQGSPRYASYLLRLRWVERDGRKTCQAMLISVATKEQRTFADLERLVAYLREQAPEVAARQPGDSAAETAEKGERL